MQPNFVPIKVKWLIASCSMVSERTLLLVASMCLVSWSVINLWVDFLMSWILSKCIECFGTLSTCVLVNNFGGLERMHYSIGGYDDLLSQSF